MIRIWLTLVIVAALIHFGIVAVRKMTGKEKLSLTKSIGYSTIVAMLAILLLGAMVVLF